MIPVLDSSAVLSVLCEEPGAEAVVEVLAVSEISAVNFAELVGKLCEWGARPDAARETLLALGISVIDHGLAQSVETGALRPVTRAFGLSLGDRACLALARTRNAPVFTADRIWEKLEIDVAINVIRN